MNLHFAFLQAILEAPDDPAPRLIYADWLEEQGDTISLARAEYLRVECALDAAPRNVAGRRTLRTRLERRTLQTRLRELHAAIGDDWWQALDCPPVEQCLTFVYRCPQRWDTLAPTAEESVRHCSECGQDVYYCRSPGMARVHAAAGRCVAVDTRALRIPGDLRPHRSTDHQRTMGIVQPRLRRRIPLPERGQPNTPESGRSPGATDQASQPAGEREGASGAGEGGHHAGVD